MGLGFVLASDAEDDLQRLRRQTREFEWAPVNPEKTLVGQADRWARELRPDGSWSDVNYADQSRGFWKTEDHLKRVWSMATLYAEERTLGRRNSALEKAALAATHFWINHDFRNPNWWHNEIAVPKYLVTAILLMQDEMPVPDKENGLKIAARWVSMSDEPELRS